MELSPLLPDPRKTPGDVLTTNATVVCQRGYSDTVRHALQSFKNLIYKPYGITTRAPQEYEVDHVVSLELGGSNAVRNLWPQSYVRTPLNAHVKDRLENRLHTLICTGQLSLSDAQQAIAKNWTTVYVTYAGPLPAGASPLPDPQ